MSYCRFSSDSFKSDVYCYANVRGGYTTHVAAFKAKGEMPEQPPVPKAGDEGALQKWMVYRQAVSAFIVSAERAPLGLPHDGKTFNDPDLHSFKERLLGLRAVGYHVPDSALQRIQEEINEEAES